MGKRSTARRLAMQALFQMDFQGSELDRSLDMLFEDEEYIDETKDFARQLVSGTSGNIIEIDGKIKQYSKNWSFDRIKSVDKSILRLAIYELMFLKDNPESVVINEALEMAKKYSDEESAKYINGILGAIAVKQKGPGSAKK